MTLIKWIRRLFAKDSNRVAVERGRSRRYVPRLECLEDRLTPAGNISLTNALLVNSVDHPQTPVVGEQVFVEADFNTQNLPVNATYHINFTVDGVTLASSVISWGAGASGTGSWNYFLGGWFASSGTHQVAITIDPDHSLGETTYADNAVSFNFTPAAPNLPQKLITPLGGTPFKTWGIVNYVDVNPAGGSATDFAGYHYTYDGHDGWDMTLGNFGAMDAGVPVYAAAAGTVVAVQDGNFDRNTVQTDPPANYIEIDIGNGWHTVYYHLRTDTILLHVGERVATGQVIGLAGSSGNSSAAHLHFALYHDEDLVEPDCAPGTYWASPLPYQAFVSSVVDSGVTRANSTMTADLDAEERPVDANVFTQQAGQELTVWFNVFSRNNDAVSVKLYQPNGQATSLVGSLTTGEYRDGYYYWTFDLPAGMTPGTWHAGIEFNGVELARDAFVVASTGAGAARVRQGSAYVANGRTTPIDFGTVSPGSTAPGLTFTIDNLGSAPLMVSGLNLPGGFSLVGSFPASIAVGAAANFTVQLSTAASGRRAGILSFRTSDPGAPSYAFNIKGVVTGGNPGAIHGQVFNDIGGDTVENGADAGLMGWTVNLVSGSANTVIATTTTGFNGYYQFVNLAAGAYGVRAVSPAGWHLSGPILADISVATGDVLASPLGMNYPATPSGVIAPAAGYDRPTFSWAPVAGADHYYLYVVDNATGAVINNPGVSGNSFTTTTALTPGHSFTWYVQAYTSEGTTLGALGTHAFILAPLSAPNSIGTSGYDMATITWTASPGADHYYLIVYDTTANTMPVVAPHVVGTSHAVTAPQALTPGHQFAIAVYAFSTNGQAYSLATQKFSLAPLPAPTNLTPSGTIAAANGYDRPTFTWTASASADHYYLIVYDTTANTMPIVAPHIAGTSYVANAAQALTPGHSFATAVYAFSTNGQAYALGTQTFTLTALAAATGLTPSGTVAAVAAYDRPTFQWSAVAGADHYYLIVYDTTANTMPLVDPKVTGTSYVASASQALTPGHSFAAAVYAFSANGQGYSLATKTFALAALPAPAGLTPSGPIIAYAGFDRPIFNWFASAGADHYYLIVYDTTAGTTPIVVPKIIGTTYTASAAQALTPGHSFATALYAFSANGQGYSLTTTNFSLAGLAAPTQTGPAGTTTSTTPTFQWTAVAGADHYYLYVVDAATGQAVVNNPNVGNGTSLVSPVPLIRGRRYTWYLAAISTNGLASSYHAAGVTFDVL